MIRRRLPATGGIELSVCDWGPGRGAHAEGAPFLLVHGLASNARLWDGVAGRLAAAGHPVVAVDQRGHGESDVPDTGYDTATVAADLVAVLDGLGWDRAVAVGQSWGGNVVLALAAAYPDRLIGVAGVDGGLTRLQQRFPSWEACLAQLTPPPLAGMPAAELRAGMEARHRGWPPGTVDAFMACFRVDADGTVTPRLTRDHHLQILRSMWDDDPGRVFEKLTVPALFIPADDPANAAWSAGRRAEVAEAERAIPRCRVAWFSPADHDVHAQFPERVADTLRAPLADGFWS